MADQVSSPPKKRRCAKEPSVKKTTAVYSNKINSLQLKFSAALPRRNDDSGDGAAALDEDLLDLFPQKPSVIALSDSEDEARTPEPVPQKILQSPSPPRTPSSLKKRKSKKTINLLNRRLQSLNSILSSDRQSPPKRTRCRASRVVVVDDDDPEEVSADTPPSVREIPLKVRCRADVHKIPVLQSTRLGEVLRRLSEILGVAPQRLLLLREEEELPLTATVAELDLGIADIIECAVMATEVSDDATLTIRLQGKAADSTREYSVQKDAPLDATFTRYRSEMKSRKFCFMFDGSRLTGGQTPAELEMEDGDIIEVWN